MLKLAVWWRQGVSQLKDMILKDLSILGGFRSWDLGVLWSLARILSANILISEHIHRLFGMHPAYLKTLKQYVDLLYCKQKPLGNRNNSSERDASWTWTYLVMWHYYCPDILLQWLSSFTVKSGTLCHLNLSPFSLLLSYYIFLQYLNVSSIPKLYPHQMIPFLSQLLVFVLVI